ncbi:MAG: ABC transporter substrate-binding protein [candidate division NC10 bacterium]|nr:ABC transporter substrate-binding protein [candidate division NC10 bacterium]
MKRKFKVALVSVVIMALGLGMAIVSQARAGQVLKVGIITSLSGSGAPIGREVGEGALLAVAQLNKAWEEKGARIEAIMLDDGTSPDQAREVASRLVTQDKVDLLFGLPDSDCALAVVPIADQARIPVLTVATHADLTQPVGRGVFRGNLSDGDQAKILVDLLWERLPEKRIALLYEETAYGRSGAAALAQRIRQYGESPVAEVSYARGERDFSSPLRKIKDAGAEGILVYGMASDAQGILEARRALRMDARIMASSGWDSRGIAELPADLTQGVIVAGYLIFGRPDREEELGPSWAQFANAFVERFGREPDVLAALSFSNMMALGEAFARVGYQTARVVEGLEATKGFYTLLETRMTFSDESHDGFMVLHLAEFAGGKLAELRRNLFPRDYRFQSASREIAVGDYRGKIYESQPRIAVWMLLHFAFGRPPFLKELPQIDDYGLKAVFSGALFKGEVRVPLFKLIFRSEKDAIEALNLDLEEGEEGQAGGHSVGSGNYRNRDSGLFTDGSLWAGYKRIGNTLIMVNGGIPREDLQRILDARI